MKFIKRTFQIVLVLLLIGFLFRGYLYRHLVTYKSIGQREFYAASNEKLIEYIELSTAKKEHLDINELIQLGLSNTSKQLNFTCSKNDTDPNKLINSKTANCIGYASFFTTNFNYLSKKYQLSGDWVAKNQIGQLYFLGINIHRFFNSSFFKDHDFVTIENKVTGEIFAIDPTVTDYLYIDLINYEP
jgi:hypothetical protein